MMRRTSHVAWGGYCKCHFSINEQSLKVLPSLLFTYGESISLCSS